MIRLRTHIWFSAFVLVVPLDVPLNVPLNVATALWMPFYDFRTLPPLLFTLHLSLASLLGVLSSRRHSCQFRTLHLLKNQLSANASKGKNALVCFYVYIYQVDLMFLASKLRTHGSCGEGVLMGQTAKVRIIQLGTPVWGSLVTAFLTSPRVHGVQCPWPD